MVKDHKYTMLWDKEEKGRLTEWGKNHGFTSLAKLIEASLDIVRRNPTLLEPTENPEPMKLLEELKNAKFNALSETQDNFQAIDERLDRFEKILIHLALKSGVTKSDLLKFQGKDASGEAVFE